MDRAYKNIWILFGFILMMIFLGFFKSYFSLLPSFQGVSSYQHLHAFLFLLWFALLFIQPFLIKTGRIKMHRLLGKSTYALVPLMTMSIFVMMREQFQRESAILPLDQCIANLIVPLPQLLLFVVLYVLAIFNKKNTPVHMRYIIGTSIVLIGPGLGRICISWMYMSFNQAVQLSFLVTELLLAVMILHDIKNRKHYKPYALLFILFLLCNTAWYFLPQSALWQTICGGFVQIFF